MIDGKQTVPTENPSGPRGAFTAAKAAAEKKIPISAISFGTTAGEIEIDGERRRVEVDDSSMKQIAEIFRRQVHRTLTLIKRSKQLGAFCSAHMPLLPAEIDPQMQDSRPSHG